MNNNNQKIFTPTLIIKDNILKYNNTFIQLSNITKCEIAPEPSKPYPAWLFIGLVIGALLLFVGITNFNSLIFIGVVILSVCGILLFGIYEENTIICTYCMLELNSGSTMLFSSREKDFLWKAQNEIINCINKRREGCIINFSNCTITYSQIGEDNFMNNGRWYNGI